MREYKRPSKFQKRSEGDVAGGAFFVFIDFVLGEGEIRVDGWSHMFPEVGKFSVELEGRNLWHVAPLVFGIVAVAVLATHVACASGCTKTLLRCRFDRGAPAKKECLVSADLIDRE